MRTTLFPLPTLLALITITASSLAQAQSFDAVRLNSAAPGQDGGTVGLALLHDKAYQGADQSRTSAAPMLDYQWATGWFAGTTNGLGYNFSKRADLQYGVRLTADFGRPANRASALTGMGDVQARAELGGFMNYFAQPDWSLSASLRQGAGSDRQGAVLDLGVHYATQLSPQWRLGLGLASTLANANYMRSYFGVSAAQTAASGYTTYAPAAGVRDTRLDVSLTYFSTPRIFITSGLRVSTLGEQARNSPLTRQSTSTTALVALGYAF